MGILNSIGTQALDAVGLGSILNNTLDTGSFGPDFANGLEIVEIVKGVESKEPTGKIKLIGSFLPFIPFDFGGTQQLSKDYYPGNPEPVMQVLGSRENDVTIRGRLKTKRLKDKSLKTVADDYHRNIDAMRRRGNIVKISLGEWRRYGIIQAASFSLKRLTDIDYSITFAIIGYSLPKNCKMIKGADDSIEAPLKAVSDAAIAALADGKNYPSSMKRSIADFLTDQIDTVASAINLVTSFVEGALQDVEDVAKSANRAIGLIKNARTKISQMNRRIAAIELSIANLSSGISLDSLKLTAQLSSAGHIKKVVSIHSNLALLLAQLQAKFVGIARTVPLRRHLVKEGDSLQQLAMQYYRNADNWENIYKHNKLTTTVLSVGTVLEIPKL